MIQVPDYQDRQLLWFKVPLFCFLPMFYWWWWRAQRQARGPSIEVLHTILLNKLSYLPIQKYNVYCIENYSIYTYVMHKINLIHVVETNKKSRSLGRVFLGLFQYGYIGDYGLSGFG